MLNREIVPADKNLRNRTIILAIVLAVVGLAVLYLLRGRLEAIKKLASEDLSSAVDQVLRLTTIVAWVAGPSFVGLGVWLWWIARRINRGGRFPPLGMKVVRDTPVRTGDRAKALARLARVVALVCLVWGTIGIWLFYSRAAEMLRQAAQQQQQ